MPDCYRLLSKSYLGSIQLQFHWQFSSLSCGCVCFALLDFCRYFRLALPRFAVGPGATWDWKKFLFLFLIKRPGSGFWLINNVAWPLGIRKLPTAPFRTWLTHFGPIWAPGGRSSILLSTNFDVLVPIYLFIYLFIRISVFDVCKFPHLRPLFLINFNERWTAIKANPKRDGPTTHAPSLLSAPQPLCVCSLLSGWLIYS